MGTNKKLELILANIVSNVLCDNILKFSKRLNKIKRAYYSAAEDSGRLL